MSGDAAAGLERLRDAMRWARTRRPRFCHYYGTEQPAPVEKCGCINCYEARQYSTLAELAAKEIEARLLTASTQGDR